MAGLVQKPISESLAIVATASWGLEHGRGDDPAVRREDELREATGGCPACILATIRQTNNYEFEIVFDWKAESKAWLAEYGPKYGPEQY